MRQGINGMSMWGSVKSLHRSIHDGADKNNVSVVRGATEETDMAERSFVIIVENIFIFVFLFISVLLIVFKFEIEK